MSEIKLERIVMALIVNGDKILLCKNLVVGHYFLPGGHIENSESSEVALDRELVEEIGRNYTDLKKVTEVRNTYEKEGKKLEYSQKLTHGFGRFFYFDRGGRRYLVFFS